MNECQSIIRARIEAAVTAGQCDTIDYQSEWLGYLPFGVYHWVECQGQDISSDFPFGWSLDDLTVLEQAGFLHVLDSYENPEDHFDRHIRYRVSRTALFTA